MPDFTGLAQFCADAFQQSTATGDNSVDNSG
jgi:hypothetical protein